MLGAIIGGIAGSRLKKCGYQSNYFDLPDGSRFVSDSSVMTLAIAKAILACKGKWAQLRKQAVQHMQAVGRKHPGCAFGNEFNTWLFSDTPKPYKGFDSDALMRVSPCGFVARTEDEAVLLAKKVTKVTHKCAEVLKGAETIAVAIFLARNGATKIEIKERVERDYYPLDFCLDCTCEDCRFSETCQEVAPLAIKAFIESDSFDSAMRNALSVECGNGALAAITGGIAEAYYGVPPDLRHKALTYLGGELRGIYREWEKFFNKINPAKKFGFITKYIGKLDYADLQDVFCDEFYIFAEAHPEYELDRFAEILEENGLKWEMDSMQSADENKLGEQCAIALIAGVFRADHYSSGVTNEFIEAGCIDRWLGRLKAIDGECVPEEDTPALTEVKIRLQPIKAGVKNELIVTEKQVVIYSDTNDGGSISHRYKFGMDSEWGEISLKVMKDCLISECWRDVQSIHEVDSAPYFYKLEAKYEDGKTVAHSGPFNRIHVPEKEFKNFVESIRNVINAGDLGGIVCLDGFMSALRPGEVKYCGVDFSSGGRIYHYRTTDLHIAVGDRVVVPVGDDNSEREVVVKTVEFCRWDNTPYPLEQTKEIIRVAKHKISNAHLIPYLDNAPFLTTGASPRLCLGTHKV